MSLMQLRIGALRSADTGRTMLLLALVGAVIVGLLAMHTFTSTSGSHGTGGSEMASGMMDHSPVILSASADHTFSLDACDGICTPGHVMSAMTCVLAVLFTTMVLAITASRRWTMFLSGLRSRVHAMTAVAAIATPPPPDLNSLSISRT